MSWNLKCRFPALHIVGFIFPFSLVSTVCVGCHTRDVSIFEFLCTKLVNLISCIMPLNVNLISELWAKLDVSLPLCLLQSKNFVLYLHKALWI